MEFIKKLLAKAPQIDQRKRRKLANKGISIFSYCFRVLILLAIGYIIIYPLFYMIVTSLRDKQSYYTAATVWIPTSINPAFSYGKAIYSMRLWEGLTNTFVLEIVAALMEVVTCAIAAYGFARFKFKFKGLLMAGLFLTVLVPETMIIIPRMVNYSKMDFFGILGFFDTLTGIDLRPNLIGSPLAFYLPSLFAMGLRSGILIFIYIQFFKGLPYELEEAAWVDGAGPVRTFLSIAVPSSGVVFITVIVFSVIWHWNDTVLASMYVKGNYPLSVHLERINMTLAGQGFYSSNVETQSILMAACFLFIIPMLVFYMILQRWFIESIDRVGITG